LLASLVPALSSGGMSQRRKRSATPTQFSESLMDGSDGRVNRPRELEEWEVAQRSLWQRHRHKCGNGPRCCTSGVGFARALAREEWEGRGSKSKRGR
jgi:hypothetical protein